jgi:hypothetical protein
VLLACQLFNSFGKLLQNTITADTHEFDEGGEKAKGKELGGYLNAAMANRGH